MRVLRLRFTRTHTHKHTMLGGERVPGLLQHHKEGSSEKHCNMSSSTTLALHQCLVWIIQLANHFSGELRLSQSVGGPVESCEWSQHAWVGAGLAYLTGCLEAQPHLTGVPQPPGTLSQNLLPVQENKWLFLEGSLVLQPPAGLMSVPHFPPTPGPSVVLLELLTNIIVV